MVFQLSKITTNILVNSPLFCVLLNYESVPVMSVYLLSLHEATIIRCSPCERIEQVLGCVVCDSRWRVSCGEDSVRETLPRFLHSSFQSKRTNITQSLKFDKTKMSTMINFVIASISENGTLKYDNLTTASESGKRKLKKFKFF